MRWRTIFYYHSTMTAYLRTISGAFSDFKWQADDIKETIETDTKQRELRVFKDEKNETLNLINERFSTTQFGHLYCIPIQS